MKNCIVHASRGTRKYRAIVMPWRMSSSISSFELRAIAALKKSNKNKKKVPIQIWNHKKEAWKKKKKKIYKLRKIQYKKH